MARKRTQKTGKGKMRKVREKTTGREKILRFSFGPRSGTEKESAWSVAVDTERAGAPSYLCWRMSEPQRAILSCKTRTGTLYHIRGEHGWYSIFVKDFEKIDIMREMLTRFRSHATV